jgi:hypothetical protein
MSMVFAFVVGLVLKQVLKLLPSFLEEKETIKGRI